MLEEVYDILVIGSGMGGMSSAALLAKEGYRVLVVERMPRIGGRCSTIEYKGFKCVTGVIGVERNGVVESLFNKLGANFNVRPANVPHYLINEIVYKVVSHGGMKKLLEAADGGSVEVEKIMRAVTKALKWKTPSPCVSLADWIRQHSNNPGILNVFQTITSVVLMVNIDELPAEYFFEYVRKLKGISNFGYCPNGSIALPQSLAQVIRDCGGDIWTRSIAKKILTENGVVHGAVVTRKGVEIEINSQVVISNIGPVKTAELVGNDKMDADYLREIEDKIVPARGVVLQVALEKPLFKQDHLFVTGAKRLNSMYQPTIQCPELAPEGKHLLIARSAPASSSTPVNQKKEINMCMEDLRALFPAFDKNAKILLTGTYYGAWPAMRTCPGRDVSQKTPIINLFNVGDGVKQTGYTGLPAVVKSGILAAEEIKQRISLLTGLGTGMDKRKRKTIAA